MSKKENSREDIERSSEEILEETMKEIIMEVNTTAAQELSKGILARVLTYCEYKATDDMTVLAAGLWRK